MKDFLKEDLENRSRLLNFFGCIFDEKSSEIYILTEKLLKDLDDDKEGNNILKKKTKKEK